MKDTLPTWDGGGHLTEIALVALADGQHGLVDEQARAHADACEACAAKLADLALESMAVGGAIARARVPRRLPVRAIAIAMALALVGLIPSVLEPGRAADILSAPHSIPMFLAGFASGVRTVAQSGTGTVASFAAAFLLVLCGVFVARRRRAVTERSS